MTHGTRTSYVKGCRCTPCRRANTTYAAENTRHLLAVKHGSEEPRLVDSTRTELHIAYLRAHGMGYRRIAEESGVAVTVIARLINLDRSRPADRVRIETQEAILKLRPTSRLVPGLIAARKLQALVAIGWTQAELAHRLDLSPSNMKPIITGSRPIYTSTDKKVDQLFRQLQNTPGRSDLARDRAKRLKWLPPLAWDDIDDPSERPQHEHIRKESRAYKIHPEDLLELIRLGWTPAEIAKRYKMKVSSVERQLYRLRGTA